MAFHKQSDFAKICRISSAQLAMDRKRHKVVITKEGLYDENDPINVAYKVRCDDLAAKRELKGETIKKKATKEKKATTTKAPEDLPAKKATQVSESNAELHEEIKKKLEVDVDLKTKRGRQLDAVAALAEMKEQRLRGEWIMTADVTALFAMHNQSLIKSFQFALDSLITDLAAKFKLNRNQQAEYRKRIIDDINSAVERAVSETDNSLESLVSDAKSKKAA